ncbi:MAG: hypothetical protein GY865_03260 [candidate division Zixibacteria bacterium]|nr:hypothetical protein [candidate division Zixibacteria bacterium]
MPGNMKPCFKCGNTTNSNNIQLFDYTICQTCKSKLGLYNDETIKGHIKKYKDKSKDHSYAKEISGRLTLLEKDYNRKRIKLLHIQERLRFISNTNYAKVNLTSLENLFREAQACQKCYPGEKIQVPLPDQMNSNENADIMMVFQRPGRLGAGKSGRISYENDDPSANFLKECLEQTGLIHGKIFITNVCLCYPLIDGYRDKNPNVREIKNCHYWLNRQLEIVKPKLIVTAGVDALGSILRFINRWPVPGGFRLRDFIGIPITDTTPVIYPVAHTSGRGRANRNPVLQKQDWLKIPEILKSL